MASITQLYQQYRQAKSDFRGMVPDGIRPLRHVNGIPVFSVDLSPAAIEQLTTISSLDKQIKEIERGLGTWSDRQTGNYAALP